MRILLALFVVFNFGFAEAKTAAPKNNKQVAKAVKPAKYVKGKKFAAYKKGDVKTVHLFKIDAYMKLPYKKRIAFLKAITEYMVATNPDRKTAYNLIELFIDSAYAAGVQRNAGFLVAPGTFTSENFDTRYLLNGFPHSCPSADGSSPNGFVPCWPGLGVNAEGKAFCVKNTPNTQFDSCVKASEEGKGYENFQNLLVSKASDPIVRGAIGNNMALIDTECKDKSTGYCGKLKTNLGKLTERGVSLASFYDTAVTTPPTDTPIPPPTNSDGSCSVVTAAGMETITGKKIDARWEQAVNLTAKICPGGRSYDNMYTNFGMCFQSNAESGKMPNDTVKAALAGANGELTMNPTQQREFMKYFGVSPSEFRNIFCQNGDSPRNFRNAINSLASGDGRKSDGLRDDAMGPFVAALENFKNRSGDIDKNSIADAFKATREKVTAGTLPKYNTQAPGAISADVIREQNERALEATRTFENYLKGSATKEQVQAVDPLIKDWVVTQMIQAAPTPSYTFMAQVRAEREAGRAEGTTALKTDELRQANASYKNMKACADKAGAEADIEGRVGEKDVFTHFGKQCEVHIDYPAVLGPRESEAYLLGPVVVQTPDGKCMNYSDILDPGLTPEENRRVKFTSPIDGTPTIMKISDMKTQGYLYKYYRCEKNYNAEEPAAAGSGPVTM